MRPYKGAGGETIVSKTDLVLRVVPTFLHYVCTDYISESIFLTYSTIFGLETLTCAF